MDGAGNVIGFIIVGVYFRSMAQVALRTALRLIAVGLVAAVLGSLLAQRLSRSIKESLLGYEPDAFARRFHQRENSPWLPPDAYVTILGNLIENAIEILNQSRSSTKEISVSIRESEESLLLCVEDTGPGIPPALRQTMFQRGATSKGRGRGTGLALVQEIAEAYHGEIRVESESGVGTSFFLSFCRESSPESKE